MKIAIHEGFLSSLHMIDAKATGCFSLISDKIKGRSSQMASCEKDSRLLIFHFGEKDFCVVLV